MPANRYFTLLCLLMICPNHSSWAVMYTKAQKSSTFIVGGRIQALCKVRHNTKSRSLRLDLSSPQAQKTNHVYIWCNTGQSSASATYSSVNQGYLVNDNGNKIPYLISIPQTANSVSLATPQTVSQRAGSGTKGEDKRRNIRVIPQVNGLEYAGVYRDTIRVTVSFN